MFHILVVEDDAETAFPVLHGNFTNNGYLALPAESGEKALSLLDSEYVDPHYFGYYDVRKRGGK